MQDNYINVSETVYLILILVGPWMVFCVICQLVLFNRLGLFKKGNILVVTISSLISSLLVVFMSVLIWIVFPWLAPNVITDHGISRLPFIPAAISSVIVVLLSAWIMPLFCYKKGKIK